MLNMDKPITVNKCPFWPSIYIQLNTWCNCVMFKLISNYNEQMFQYTCTFVCIYICPRANLYSLQNYAIICVLPHSQGNNTTYYLIHSSKQLHIPHIFCCNIWNSYYWNEWMCQARDLIIQRLPACARTYAIFPSVWYDEQPLLIEPWFITQWHTWSKVNHVRLWQQWQETACKSRWEVDWWMSINKTLHRARQVWLCQGCQGTAYVGRWPVVLWVCHIYLSLESVRWGFDSSSHRLHWEVDGNKLFHVHNSSFHVNYDIISDETGTHNPRQSINIAKLLIGRW